MSKHGFISSYKYQLRRIILLPIISIAAGIAAIILMAGLINYSLDGKLSFENAGTPCIDSLGGLVFFFYGVILNQEFLNTGAANGVSRTTTLIASMASFFTGSAACSAFISVVSPLINLIFRSDSDYFFIEFFYGTKKFFLMYGENEFLVRIRFFVMCTIVIFMCAAVGILFSSIYYKLPKKGTVILSVVLMIFLFFGYPFSKAFLAQRGIDIDEKLKGFFISFGRLFGMAHVNGSQAGNFIQGALMMLLFAAVCAVIAWLFVRRANVKPAPIRGE